MRRVLMMAGLATALAAAAPAGAQPTCALGFAADYNALGATGCQWGGLTFSNFAVDVAPNPFVNPLMIHGLTMLQLGTLSPALQAIASGPPPGGAGTPYSVVRSAEMSFNVAGASGMWLVLDPFSLQVLDAISGPPWEAYAASYLENGGHRIVVAKRAFGGPAVEECSVDFVAVACDLASTRVPYTGGRVTAGTLVSVGAAVAPDFNGGIATSGGLYFGFAAVPEPSTLALLGAGLAALATAARRRRER